MAGGNDLRDVPDFGLAVAEQAMTTPTHDEPAVDHPLYDDMTRGAARGWGDEMEPLADEPSEDEAAYRAARERLPAFADLLDLAAKVQSSRVRAREAAQHDADVQCALDEIERLKEFEWMYKELCK